MTELFIDIETIPAQRPDVFAEISASKSAKLAVDIAAIKVPGNYKNPELIDKWNAEERPKQIAALNAGVLSEVDDAYRKTSFDGAYGQICVIGFAVDDRPAQSYHVDDLSAVEERQLLEHFACSLADCIASNEVFSTVVIGHNVAAFDLRFLVQRHIIHNMRPHAVIGRAAQAKPWETDRVYDTMVQWSGLGKSVSLDKLCKALSVPTPKDGIDGSMVWDFVNDGRIEEVAAYCRKDVEATRAVHRRMTYQVEAVSFEDVAS